MGPVWLGLVLGCSILGAGSGNGQGKVHVDRVTGSGPGVTLKFRVPVLSGGFSALSSVDFDSTCL